jgi:hypothetical protein
MYRIRNRGGRVGEFYDDEQCRTLWREGITQLKFVTCDGLPLVPPYARKKLDANWRAGIQTLHVTGWGK